MDCTTQMLNPPCQQLQAENARLSKELAQITSDRNAKSARMWELGKLCDELEPDAKRYRWLRDTQEGKTVRILDRREWDEAIDDAIAKENGK